MGDPVLARAVLAAARTPGATYGSLAWPVLSWIATVLAAETFRSGAAALRPATERPLLAAAEVAA